MFKNVSVVKVNTMADGTVRLTIDLLSGNGDDMKASYSLMSKETVMLLTETDKLVDDMTSLVHGLTTGEVTLPSLEEI